MNELINVLLIEPDQYPRMILLENSPAGFKAILGGDDIVANRYWEDPVAVISHNGNAIGSDCRLNRVILTDEIQDLIFGPLLICGLKNADVAEPGYIGLSQKLCEKYIRKFHQPPKVHRTEDGVVMIEHTEIHEI